MAAQAASKLKGSELKALSSVLQGSSMCTLWGAPVRAATDWKMVQDWNVALLPDPQKLRPKESTLTTFSGKSWSPRAYRMGTPKMLRR